MFSNEQSEETALPADVDHRPKNRDPENSDLLEDKFSSDSLKETAAVSFSVKSRTQGDLVVGQQDLSYSLDGTSDEKVKKRKFHVSCMGRWRFPFFKHIRSAKRSAKTSSRKILASNSLFVRGKERPIPHDAMNTVGAFRDLKHGAILANKYCIIEGKTDDDPYVRHAVDVSSEKRVFLRLYDDLDSLRTAESYHRTNITHDVCRWIETVDDLADNLPFLVLEGGDCTFDQWLAQPGRPFAEKRRALGKILEALADLHAGGRKIGNLTPNRIVWFSTEGTWKLLDLCVTDTGRRERPSHEHPGAKYAAPESVLFEPGQEKSAEVGCASDMWSFGAMILEVILTGQSLCYPEECPETDQRIALSRQISFRLASVPGEYAYTLLRNLLQIDPIKRCTAPQALRSAFFQTPDRPRTITIPQNEIRCLLRRFMNHNDQTSLHLTPRTTPKTSITVEYFRKRSNSSDPFHLRPGKDAYVISDTVLPHQPIFLLRAGQNFRLRLRPECDDASPIPPPHRVKTVYARVDEGEYIALDTKMMLGQRNTLEVVALVEPARLQSPRLLTPTMSGEDHVEKYVKVDVVMNTALVGDDKRIEERQHVIYCKILPRTGRMRQHYRKEINETGA